MPKIHLAQTQIPLSEGRDVDAMCGRTIQRAIIGAMCDSAEFADFVSELSNSARTCQKCVSQPWNQRYLYAVREGQNEYQSHKAVTDTPED